MISERRLADVLAEFARTLLTDFPIQGILDHLVGNIVEILPIDAAGVSLISPTSQPQLISGSDERAARYEHLQSELAEGPCVAAYRTGGTISIPDLAREERFPRFVESALAEGLVAVFTFPLRAGDRTLGALDLYRRSAGSLDERAMEVAQTLADVTTAYLLNAQSRLATVDLVAGVSHELRTPMASMVGFLELLQSGGGGSLTSEQQHFVASIHRGVDRLTGLADNLLTLAVLAEPAAQEDQRPLDLGALTTTAGGILASAIEARGLDVSVEVPLDPVMVLGVSQALESLVLNLLTNALKFTEDGGWVRCRLSLVSGAARLEVSDNGLGIPAEEQDRLFSRFFRSSTARERAIQGTGLGLTIVEAIVNNHGGDISVESTHLVGSTFTVTLPLLPLPGDPADGEALVGAGT